MNFHAKTIARIIGNQLFISGFAMLLPLFYAAALGEGPAVGAFAVPAILSLVLGGTLTRIYRNAPSGITQKDGILLLVIGWLCISLLSALPYLLSGLTHSLISALFESISAFTTTGASILRNIGGLPRSILLWRSLSQWLGGLGILVLMQTMLPTTYENPGNLILAQHSEVNADNITFSRKSSSRTIYLIYICLTLLQILLLRAGGLTWLDSLAFGSATASTGGINCYSDGLMHVATPYIEAVLAIFMLLACTNFTFFIHLIRWDKDKIFHRTELNAYLGIVLTAILLVTANLRLSGTYDTVGEAFRYGSFQSVSFMTTTGLVSTDCTAWPSFSQMLLTVLSFIGGCASSTGGGLKVIRVVILSKIVWRNFSTRIHPNAVITIKTNRQPVPSRIANGVVAYTLTYFTLLLLGAFLLSFDVADMQTAFTASAAALNNVGSGFGQMGIFAQYDTFNRFSQLVLSILMLAGRLEIYAVILPLTRAFWKEKI